MTVTVERLRSVLTEKFGGLLRRGAHKCSQGEACALELLSAAKEIDFTDSPSLTGSWDLRPINDMYVSDELRTEYLLPVLAIYADAQSWDFERQKAVAERIAILTVNRIVAELPYLPEGIRVKCRETKTLQDAAAAAADAADATARAARAVAAARAAAYAAYAADAADAAAADAAAYAAYAADAAARAAAADAAAADAAARAAAADAVAAARAAARAAATAAADAVAAARAAATAAAAAAAAAARERVFRVTCQLWIDAVA